ncbi:hypothetical protein [Allorhizobium borbori]|uniref:Uncharacterized protein n=1 Tax=Allorhizobium borbori TaxID=485907 RepID=A0A7W6K0W9_9HYPH|nr:hypothetical protein [Allorhizobium borbori]MBB4103106.1 hypothetical protein [Allorhizobium borbori]
MLDFVGNLLLRRQPAVKSVEFAPPFEDKPLDKLPMVVPWTASASPPAPDLHRNRLPSGARRNLPVQTIKMPLGLTPSADCLRQKFWNEDVDHDPSPRFRQPMKEDGP